MNNILYKYTAHNVIDCIINKNKYDINNEINI